MDNSDCSVDGLEEKKLEHGINHDDSNTTLQDPTIQSCASTNTSSDGVRNHDHFRMETAWAQVEAEYSYKQMAQGPQSPSSSHHVSPLMGLSESIDGKPTSFMQMNRHHGTKDRNSQVNHTETTSLMQQSVLRPSLIERYRTFLQKHEPSLDILERIMERFVFYRYLFNHDHSGMKIELYYAAWNILRWVNDVVLVGWGEGMGMTIGTRNQWLGNKTEMESTQTFQAWAVSRIHVIVPVLRAILTATTCVYPALEAWSRRPVNSRPKIPGCPLQYPESQQEEEWKYATTTDVSPRSRRLQWESRQSNAANLSYWVERIRFVSRLTLLAISWWARHRRQRERTTDVSAVPSLLRRGGELDPCEELLPITAADSAAAAAQYKGKRTGRRSVSSTAGHTTSSSDASIGLAFVKYLNKLISAKHNILYFHIVGELLHILRPLYWSRSESTAWKRRATPSDSVPHNQSNLRFSLWKSWLISLVMDILSDEILDITTGCKTHLASNKSGQRRTSLMSQSTGRNVPYSSVTSVVQSEQDELTWRRGRRSLYLLRSPVYGSVTLPIMTAVTRVLSKIPSFGLGRWASEYILDMMSYWNEHRFMLE